MANPAIVAFKTGNFIASSITNIGVTSSRTPADGNTLLAGLVVQGVSGEPGEISSPGWNPEQQATVSGNYRAALFSMIALSESGSYSFSWPNLSVTGFWIFAEYAGGDGDHAIDGTSQLQSTSTSINAMAPSVTPSTWNSFNTLVCMWAAAAQLGTVMTLSPPGDMTMQAQSNSQSTGFPALMLADLTLSSNADTGIKTASTSAATSSVGISLLVKQSINQIPVGGSGGM